MTNVQLQAQVQEPDLPSALFLAAICGQTYVQSTNKESGLFILPEEYKLVGAIATSSMGINNDHYGFMINSNRYSILAFRGTSTSVDWVHDFKAQQMAFSPIKNAGNTHKGFTDIYLALREQIFQLLSLLQPDCPLFITGHSLGGALATLAAIDIATNSAFTTPIIYTFGAPRVGNPAFVKTYNATVPTHWRIQNKFDIVPHLPTLVYHSPHTDETYFYLHVKGEVQRSFRNGSVASNHLLSNYFQNLAEDMPQISSALCASPLGFCPNVELS